MKTKTGMVLALGLGMAVTASAALTHRWTINETGGVSSAGGIFEAVSGSTTTALFGDIAGVVGNPGAATGDLAYLFKGNAANNGGNGVATPLTNVLPATGNFSVFVTAKFATNYQDGGRLLFSNNNGQGGRIDFAIGGNATTPNRLTFFCGGTPNLSISFTDSVVSPVLFTNGWHEVGLARSGSTFQLYVDGVARGTPGTSTLAISTNTAYRIGRRNAFTGFFNNLIAEVQVFNEVCTTGLPIVLYDADGDLIADTWEILYFIAPGEDPVADLTAILARCDPGGDSDSDGLTNLAEFNAGTNPNLADTDNDGLGDGVETNTGTWFSDADTGTNPLKADTDGATNLEEFQTPTTILIARDGEGAITGTRTAAGSSNPNDANSQPDTDTDGLPIFTHWRGGNPSAGDPVLWDARTAGWIQMKAGYSLFGYNSASPSSLGTETPNHPFGAEVTFAERIREGRHGRKVAVIKYSQGATGLGTATAPGAWDPATGRTIGHWKLDEPALPWTGANYGGIIDSLSGTEGVLCGYAQTDQALVAGSVVNRAGPQGNTDRAFNGNFEGQTGDVIVLNHAADEPLRTESLLAQSGGVCQLAWRSRTGFEYALEWSAYLVRWNLFRIVPAGSGTSTQDSFPDPGTGHRLFLRIR